MSPVSRSAIDCIQGIATTLLNVGVEAQTSSMARYAKVTRTRHAKAGIAFQKGGRNTFKFTSSKSFHHNTKNLTHRPILILSDLFIC